MNITKVKVNVRKLKKHERVPKRALCFLGPAKFHPKTRIKRRINACVKRIQDAVYEHYRQSALPKIIVEPKSYKLVKFTRVHIKVVPADSVPVFPPLDRSKLPPISFEQD